MGRRIFWAALITFVILAICNGWGEDYYGDKEFRPLIFFGTLIGGLVASYYSAMLLYGFGELVDKVTGLHAAVTSSIKNAPSNGSITNTTQKSDGVIINAVQKPTAISANAVQNPAGIPTNTAYKVDGKTWLCSCGRRNPSYMSSCVCGKTKNGQ